MKIQLDKLIPGNLRWGIGTVVNVADDVGRDMIASGVGKQVPDGTRDRIVPYAEEVCVPVPKTEKAPKPPKEEETE